MKNYFIINYTLRKLSVTFDGENFYFDLPVVDKTNFSENFDTSVNGSYTIEFFQNDETMTPIVMIYKNSSSIRNIDVLKNTNPLSFRIPFLNSVGDPELYFYTNQ